MTGTSDVAFFPRVPSKKKPAAVARLRSAALTVPLERARAHWYRRQGLPDRPFKDIPELIARSGWLRTFAGADAYFALWARHKALRRTEVDAAVNEDRIQITPAVRGCIYIVPHEHAGLALTIADEQSSKRTVRDMATTGVTAAELKELGKAILSVLKKSPLTTDGIRKALPAGAVRSLGEKGKKVGMTSTLPTAIRRLEFDGQIERSSEGGRIDSDRYLWRLPKRRIFDAPVPADAVGRAGKLAELFFTHFGPATTADFAGWTGSSQRDAKAGIEKAGLVRVAVEGYSDECWVPEADLAGLKGKGGDVEGISLLALEDNYLVQHGDLRPMVAPEDDPAVVKQWGAARKVNLTGARSVLSRTLLIDGLLSGVWEYDPDAQEVIYSAFRRLTPKHKKGLDEQAARLGKFIRDEIGHALSNALDSEQELKKRVREVKKLR